jgi:hypothetical protein
MSSNLRRSLTLFIICVSIPALYIAYTSMNPGASFDGVSQMYRQGNEWIEVPRLDQPAYKLIPSQDGAIWGLTPSGLYRWSGTVWQKIYAPHSHPTDFELSGNVIWLSTHKQLVRCDTTSLECADVRALDMGYDVAAWGDEVYAVSQTGQIVWFDGTSWQEDVATNLLPGFTGTDDPFEILFTDDGTLWLQWNQLWRYDGTWSAVTLGTDTTTRVGIVGTTPGLLWTSWSNGLVAVLPDLSDWQLFTWEEMNAPGSNWIFDISADQDNTIWLSTKTGLSHFDGEAWAFQPLPDDPLVTAVSFTSENTMWVQTTDSNSASSILPMVFLVVVYILLHWSGGRLMGAVTTYLNSRTFSSEKAKNSA